MKGFGYTLCFFCFIFILCFWLYVWFPCIWLLLYTGAFEEERFIWTKTKVHFFYFPCVRLTRIRFFFFFASTLPVKKEICCCMCMISCFVFASSLFFGFFSYFAQVYFKKKGSFEQEMCVFFYLPCVTLTRIGFFFASPLPVKKRFSWCMRMIPCFIFVSWLFVFFFVLYTGAFEEERFIWTKKVHFFLLSMC